MDKAANRETEESVDAEVPRGLPPAAGVLPAELLRMWEVDLGETDMAVIFDPDSPK